MLGTLDPAATQPGLEMMGLDLEAHLVGSEPFGQHEAGRHHMGRADENCLDGKLDQIHRSLEFGRRCEGQDQTPGRGGNNQKAISPNRKSWRKALPHDSVRSDQIHGMKKFRTGSGYLRIKALMVFISAPLVRLRRPAGPSVLGAPHRAPPDGRGPPWRKERRRRAGRRGG